MDKPGDNTDAKAARSGGAGASRAGDPPESEPHSGGRETVRSEARGSSSCAGRTRFTRREHLLLALVLLLALGMRAWHWSGQASHNPLFGAPLLDQGQHDEWARLIASGEGLGDKPFFRAPLYYHALAGLYAVAGPNVALARFLGCVIGAVSCYLLAHLGAVLGGFRTGLIAGLVAAFYWPLIYFDNLLLTIGFEIFLNTLMLLVLVYAARRGSALLFLAGGVVWGLSAITRPTVLAIAPLMLLWVWFGRGGSGLRLRGLRDALLVLFGALLVISPVTIRNRVVGGSWALIATSGGVNFCMGNNPESDGMSAVIPGLRSSLAAGSEDWRLVPAVELGYMPSEQEASRYWGNRALAWIRAEPGAWARLMVHKLRLFWSPIEITNNMPIRFFAGLSPSSALYWIGFPVVACLGLAGLTQLRGSWRTWLLPVLFLAGYMLTVVAFFCPARFRLPVAPVLILLTAQGLVQVAGTMRRGAFAALGGYAAIGVAVAVFLVTNPPERGPYATRSEALGHFNLSVHYRNAAAADPAQLDKTVAHLRKSIALMPNSALYHMALAEAYEMRGESEEAAVGFAAAVEAEPRNAQALARYGKFLVSVGRHADAAEQFAAAIENNPARVDLRVQWALALANAKDYEGALAILKEADRLHPDVLDVRHATARVLSAAGRRSAAADEYRAILKRWPDNLQVMLELGAVLFELGEHQQAVEQWATVIERQPAHGAAAYNLALVQWRMGRNADAIATLREYLRHRPDDIRALNTLATRLAIGPDAALRDGPEAVEIARRALSVAGEPRADLLETLASALAEAGRFDEAVAAARQALERARGDADVANRLEARIRLYQQGRAFHQRP